MEGPGNKTSHAEQLHTQQVQQRLMQLLLISEKLPKDQEQHAQRNQEVAKCQWVQRGSLLLQ